MAAGRGVRAQKHPEDPLKQFRKLGDRPLILWSLDALRRAGCSKLIAVVPPDLMDVAKSACEGVADLVPGGDTRQQSVRHGIARVTADTVIVHDAARPLVTPELISSVIEGLGDADAAIPAIRVGETIKSVAAGYVTATIDRKALWLAQTPQVFRSGTLAAAHERAESEGFESTDDAQLVERYGGRVAIVESSPANLKITYADDFALAEALLAARPA